MLSAAYVVYHSFLYQTFRLLDIGYLVRVNPKTKAGGGEPQGSLVTLQSRHALSGGDLDCQKVGTTIAFNIPELASDISHPEASLKTRVMGRKETRIPIAFYMTLVTIHLESNVSNQ